jgi:hypothetical protein
MSSVWPGFSELNEEQARLVLQCPVVMAEEVSKVGWVSEGSYEDFFDGSEGIDNIYADTGDRFGQTARQLKKLLAFLGNTL